MSQFGPTQTSGNVGCWGKADSLCSRVPFPDVTQVGLLRHPNSMDAKGSLAGRLDCASGVRSLGVQ